MSQTEAKRFRRAKDTRAKRPSRTGQSGCGYTIFSCGERIIIMFCGNNSCCLWIVIILIILLVCGNGNGFGCGNGCGNDNGCNCGC